MCESPTTDRAAAGMQSLVADENPCCDAADYRRRNIIELWLQ